MNYQDFFQLYITKLGYEIVEPLFGGSASVYKVQKGSEVSVAKAGVKKESALLDEIYRDLVRERLVLEKTAKIPGIVRQQAYHRTKFNHFDVAVLVRDYIEGKMLGEDQGLNQRQCEILGRTVKAVHSIGVASLDIKSANIVVDGEGFPYLIDLGTALFAGKNKYLKGVDEDLEKLNFFCRRHNPNFNK
ncbi:MAG: hypothetical protein AABX31_04320 [Nanoarchaeota archaeon]